MAKAYLKEPDEEGDYLQLGTKQETKDKLS